MIMSLYAVTGASGQLGRLAVKRLLARGIAASGIVAVVRDRSRVSDLAALGVQLREADYTDPETLVAALAGVSRLLLVSSSSPGQRLAHHANAIGAAKAAGVTRIVYTGMLNSGNTSNPLAPDHEETERALRESGVPFTSLRNGWYTENYTAQLGQYLDSGVILGAAGHGRISAAARQDYADAAVAALLQDADGNRTYELGGPSFDLPELARIISEVTGTNVTYRDLPVDAYARELRRAGLDEASAGFVAALDASLARGDLETESRDLEHLIGRSPTEPAQVVRRAYEQLDTTPTTPAG
jgi:NAD(P)H dehydrogenase (quinone)